jgi:hypothetical protein
VTTTVIHSLDPSWPAPESFPEDLRSLGKILLALVAFPRRKPFSSILYVFSGSITILRSWHDNQTIKATRIVKGKQSRGRLLVINSREASSIALIDYAELCIGQCLSLRADMGTSWIRLVPSGPQLHTTHRNHESRSFCPLNSDLVAVCQRGDEIGCERVC